MLTYYVHIEYTVDVFWFRFEIFSNFPLKHHKGLDGFQHICLR